MVCDRRFVNVLILGFSFMFIFTAFQTGSMIQKVVIKNIKVHYTSYEGEGYTSLAIIYAVLAVCNWLAPSVITYTGPKYAMIIGGITYCIFIANFLYPMTWGLYFTSVLIGAGAALIWTGQGNYLTINSDSETMSRNSGIFWAQLQCSLLFGNIFVYFQFKGEDVLTIHTINIVFGGLLGVCCLGTLLLLTLRMSQGSTFVISGESENQGPMEALVKAFNLFRTSDMILLSFTFLYTGLELSFFSSVYPTAVSYTKAFGEDAAKFVGISGILVGAGEILGGTTFGLLGKKTNKYGKDPIVLLGYIVHMITFFLIFINLPSQSPITDEGLQPTYMKSNVYLAIFCSFLLGFGDSCFNTQIYSILGVMYPQDSAPAFALFKFVQSVAAAVAFFYSTAANLPIQLAVLVILGTMGSLSFFSVEWKLSKGIAPTKLKQDEPINS